MITPDPAPAPIDEEDGEMRRTSVTLSLQTTGDMHISERTEEVDERDFHVVVELLPNLTNVEMELSFYIAEDEDGIWLGLSAYGVEAPETKRTFTTTITALLNTRDLERLRAYITFLLDGGLDGVSND